MFQKNQRVVAKDYGLGTVVKVDDPGSYPIYVIFDNGDEGYYTQEGVSYSGYTQSVFPFGPSPDQEVWLRFACAIASQDEWIVGYIAETADKLLQEYKKRFP